MTAMPRDPETGKAEDTVVSAFADRLGVVVISYHSDALVTSLVQKFPEKIQVIVIDNARESGLASSLAAVRPTSVYRHYPENLGFGGGVNAGVSLLATDFVLVLNPDTHLDLDVIAQGLRELDAKPRIGATGELRFLRVNRFRLGRYVTGAFLLMRRAAFDAVGGFDDDFFLFFEDTDLSVRFEAAGYRLAQVANLPRHNDGNSVEPENDSHAERLWLMGASARLFRSKHRFSGAGLWVRWHVLEKSLEARRAESARIFMKGYRDAKGHIPGCLRENLFTTGARRA